MLNTCPTFVQGELFRCETQSLTTGFQQFDSNFGTTQKSTVYNHVSTYFWPNCVSPFFCAFAPLSFVVPHSYLSTFLYLSSFNFFHSFLSSSILLFLPSSLPRSLPLYLFLFSVPLCVGRSIPKRGRGEAKDSLEKP